MKTLLLQLALVLFASFSLSNGENYDVCPKPNAKCDTSKCKLPDCSCAGEQPSVPLKDRPQIVYLTFDDGLSKRFDDAFYSEVFGGQYKNPNGCPIRATFFVTARANEFDITNKFYRNYHEIGVHSISHRTNATYWRTLSPRGWADEMGGMRNMLEKFSLIPKNDIRGIRAPYLKVGGDEMAEMLRSEKFSYDCSMPSRKYGFTNLKNGLWPFTLDYTNNMDCQIEPCPQCSSPGTWVQPILDFEDARDDPNGNGYPCAMTDTCQVPNANADKTYEMLKMNFDTSYNGNTRAPIGIYIHASWFVVDNANFEAYKKFLSYILGKNDVWVVPVWDGIQYFKNPVTNQELKDKKFEPFNCKSSPMPDDCEETVCDFKVHNEDIDTDSYYMHVCGDCPDYFPWLGNPLGTKSN